MDARLVVVIGGGIAGLTFAALHRKNGGSVLVLDQTAENNAEDGKSVVIGARSMSMLENAGVNSAPKVPLSRLRVFFENAPGGGVIQDGIIGYGIAHREVRHELSDIVGGYTHAEVKSLTEEKNAVHITYQTAEKQTQVIEAAAAVVACAAPFLPSPFISRDFDFGQGMISFAAKAQNMPPGDAVESFTRHGIVAVVPRTDSQKGIIVCADESTAGKIAAQSDDVLMSEINDVFGGEFGFHSPGARVIYAPRFRRASPQAAGRIALLGAGATTPHPAGAQGLNLGLADAECLAQLLKDESTDIPGALSAYCRRRTAAHGLTAGMTSVLAAGGHLRQWPFRIAGGMAAGALFTATAPFRRSLLASISGIDEIPPEAE